MHESVREQSHREPLGLVILVSAALFASAIGPTDRLTWLLEVFPVLLGIPILLATQARFPLTPLLYRLLFLHALILIRCSPLRPGKWLFVLVTSVCLAFSAFYELIEWWAVLLGGGSAVAFLGTQGDVWDTQWDMFLALIGCLSSQILLSRRHDAEIARLRSTS